jgi:hypothetical protein
MSVELIVWFNSPDNGNPGRSIFGEERIGSGKKSGKPAYVSTFIRGTKISGFSGNRHLISFA